VTGDESTVPRRVQGIPVKSIAVEVIGGRDQGRRVVGQEAITVGTANGNSLVLGDPLVSRYHLELRREADRVLLVDLGSTNGAAIGSVMLRGSSALIAPGSIVTVGDTQLRVSDGEVVMVDTASGETLSRLRGRAPATRQLFSTLERVAKSRVNVLLVGESGTGKELAARAIHELSDQSRPYATVDCAAVVPSLFPSELFGHERGAFTGADRRYEGAFSRANGGTIFLDEIGELSLELQSALLGVVERRRFRPVGGRDELPVDVRIISATNRDLRSEVNAGRFRLDLFYRLAVVQVRMPPLRERREDIPLLVEHFLREAGHTGPPEDIFDAPAMARLLDHDWPGNLRELRNLVEATLVVGSGAGVTPRENESAVSGPPAATAPALFEKSYKEARRTVLDQFERDYLQALLARTAGNVRQAARDAQMDRSYLIELLKRHELP
jgi:DNA-binding NtrC family response regulator